MSPRSEEQNRQIRDERRQQILRAAMKVFARKGLAATKISDIATAAGLSHGLIYHYFSSKDEIFTVLVGEALEISLGTINYAAHSTGSPWERLRAVTETIISGSSYEEGPYYYLIMLQAFISEAVPPAVKEMVEKMTPLYTEYLVALLKEGQQAGEVAGDDPLQLANLYYSMITGLAIMKIQTGEAMPAPTAEMVLRLIKGGGGREEGLSGSEISVGRFGPVKLVDSLLAYKRKKDGGSSIFRVSATRGKEDGIPVCRIEEQDEAGGRMLAIVQAEDWRPLKVQSFNANGELESEISYRNGSVTFDIPKRKIHKTIKLSGDYHDINTLFYVLRAFPFGSNEKVHFNLVTDGRGNSPVGAFGMFIQEVGRESVETPAGSFDCYKLEMGIGGAAGIFAARYKSYFWYTVDEPRFLVRYEDKKGNSLELLDKSEGDREGD